VKVITLVGTRPELIKLSPVLPLLGGAFEHRLVHSGQHYSYEMDAIFFQELQLPAPVYQLEVGSGTHSEQTARLLTRFEGVLLQEQPDGVVVLGDTNTTLAGMLTAAKLNLTAVHLEAGCRSFNRQMPEEINRVVADRVADWCFAPGERERANLLAEGVPAQRIRVVGSTAIDACLRNQMLARDRTTVQDLGLIPGGYVLLTLHRAENTRPEVLLGIVQAVNHLAQHWPFVFPVHPRTRGMLDLLAKEDPLLRFHPNVHLLEPVGYLDILALLTHARAVMTDSGGLQEEAGALGTPLLVVRNETEWTYLVEAGAAKLTGNAFDAIVATAGPALAQGPAAFQRVDVTAQQGAAERIVLALQQLLNG
jgi:UDP-N-acetylglucosamine 2-epimerase